VVDFFAQRQVFASQRLFGSLSIFNIGARRIPSYDPSMFIAERIVLDEMPAILPALPSRAHFQFERGPTQKARVTLGSYPVYVIRMECLRKKAASPNLFECETGLVKSDPIHIECSSIRRQDGDLLGNSVGDLMDCNLPSPAVGFLRGETRIVVPSLVEEFHGTVRQPTPYERRNRINDFSQSGFRLLDPLKRVFHCWL
jgi:hypothetical protein